MNFKGLIANLSATVMTVFSLLAATMLQADGQISHRSQIAKDGLGLYIVFLDKDVVERVEASDEPPAVFTRDPGAHEDVYSSQRPQARKLVKQLAKEFDIRVVSMTSHIRPSLSAYMPTTTVERMRSDARVQSIVAALEGGSRFSAWSDGQEGTEWVPWGKKAVAYDNSTFAGTVVYMIDGPAIVTASPVTVHNDLNLQLAGYHASQPVLTNAGHATHIAGVLGAYLNATGVRGVAPGVQIINVVTDNTPTQNIHALDWVYGDIVSRGPNFYAVVNISSAGEDWSWTDPNGLRTYVERLKTRALIVQAAGNWSTDACNHAYGVVGVGPNSGPGAVPNDGYLVVGGIDDEGRHVGMLGTTFPYSNDFDGQNLSTIGGSNYGSCVEVWGPSQNVRSTWNTSLSGSTYVPDANAIKVLGGGTSMAAPHVAATAARLCGNTTPPSTCEGQVRSKFLYTGYAALHGAPVRIASESGPGAGFPLSRLTNISTRGQVQTGDNQMFGGFVIGGSTAKTVVVRARGPSLVSAGIPNALANPQMTLFSGATPIGVNDDWQAASNQAAISQSGFAPADPLESAIMMTLNPGAYTAIISGVGGGTGVGIFEVFEVDNADSPLINVATRGQVQTGGDVMIAGFVVSGSRPQVVVVRARGPSLAAAGVPGALSNPVLQLFSGQNQIASSDNWQDIGTWPAVYMAGFGPPNLNESAVIVQLSPGPYTVVVSGAAGGTGVGIVEVFSFQ